MIHWLADSRTETVVGMGGLTVYGDIADRRDRSEERMGELDQPRQLAAEHALPGLNPVVGCRRCLG